MTKAAYVLDTHALIWHLQASDSLSSTARSILDTIDAGEATGIVPSITLVEMVYLVEKKRIAQEALDAALSCLEPSSENYQLAPLNLAVVEGLRQIPRSVVPDMPDRIVAATAIAMGAPLLSKDSEITSLEGIEVIW